VQQDLRILVVMSQRYRLAAAKAEKSGDLAGAAAMRLEYEAAVRALNEHDPQAVREAVADVARAMGLAPAAEPAAAETVDGVPPARRAS